MHEEEYEISHEAAESINRALRENRRIIACGTTSVRVLETIAKNSEPLKACRGTTQLFIYPPYPFKIVKGLITNFHLPKSTLLLLTAAFLGSMEGLKKIYQEAIEQNYRFFSYGDAMFIY